jgi:hypothetical protein
VEHAPHVDVVFPLDVEDYVREAWQRPAAKSVYLQLGCVPGRADGGMLAKDDVGVFERVDESERSRSSSRSCLGNPCRVVVIVDIF